MSEFTVTAIPDQYIVVFKQDEPNDVQQKHCEWAQSTHTQAAALRTKEDGPRLTGVGEQFKIDNLAGYFGSFDGDLKSQIENREEVGFVEQDFMISETTKSKQDPKPSDRGNTKDSTAGAGTWAYIIGTGILLTHKDLGGRAKWGTNLAPGSSDTDRRDQGTLVARTVGGTKHGMAKKCNLIAVKVIGDDGKGSTSSVIKGVEWAVNDAMNNGRLNKSIANMPFGNASPALYDVVAAAIRAGLAVAPTGIGKKDAGEEPSPSEGFGFTIIATDGGMKYNAGGAIVGSDGRGPGSCLIS